ncbi:MAG: hypothetical protein EBZ50_04310 [Alphaproteobacteria bacterium]|nr:hypothetical protein [Alphaproteobacteria bacterium]
MPREVDPKRTRKALRTVRELAARVDAPSPDSEGGGEPPDYSEWERTFLAEVETRLQTYGSAFANLAKGHPDEALSALQAQKLKEIAAKAAGEAPRKGFKTRKPLRARRPERPPPERD